MFTLEALIYLYTVTVVVSEGSQLKHWVCIVASGMTNSSLKTRKGLLVSLFVSISVVHYQTCTGQSRFELYTGLKEHLRNYVCERENKLV